jgi:prevent-host-death family protein
MNISLTEDFKTVSELAGSTQEILQQVRDTGRTVAITIDGKPAAVLLGVAQYESLLHLVNLSRALHQAEADIQAGRVRPLGEFLDELSREQKAARRNNRKRRA